MSYSETKRESLAPPSRVSGFHTAVAVPVLERVRKASNGTLRYTPLSKLPSPNCSAETLVLEKNAPNLTPFLNTRDNSTVAPKSLAR